VYIYLDLFSKWLSGRLQHLNSLYASHLRNAVVD
jgi:hypothetical protein